MRRAPIVLALLLVIAVVAVGPLKAQTLDEPVVRAVLFYSPTCPHCHTVVNETIVPMLEQYGQRLEIIGIDITQPGGQVLYDATTERFQIPPELQGVPRLIVGETVLVGSVQIPQQFPAIVEAGLQADGIDWPDLPGLKEAIAAAQEQANQASAPTAAPPATTPTPIVQETATGVPPAPTSTPDAQEMAMGTSTATPTPEVLAMAVDSVPPQHAETSASGLPDGGGLATAILGSMLLALVFAAVRIVPARDPLLAPSHALVARAQSWGILLLALAGLGVALYLAYVEITQVEAVCGPVGECNVVQASEYAKLAGIPVAVLGVINYVAIIALWAIQRLAAGRWGDLAARGLVVLTVAGVLFSIYLTLLELVVIHAVCAWCLTSAVITTALMILVVDAVTRSSPSLPVSAQQDNR